MKNIGKNVSMRIHNHNETNNGTVLLPRGTLPITINKMKAEK